MFLLDGGWTDRAGELEDERRLFYVAMTRAMENLVVVRAEGARNVFADELREAEGAFVRASAARPSAAPAAVIPARAR